MSDCQLCDVEHICGYEYKPCDCAQQRKFKELPSITCDGCLGAGYAPYPMKCRPCKGSGRISKPRRKG